MLTAEGLDCTRELRLFLALSRAPRPTGDTPTWTMKSLLQELDLCLYSCICWCVVKARSSTLVACFRPPYPAGGKKTGSLSFVFSTVTSVNLGPDCSTSWVCLLHLLWMRNAVPRHDLLFPVSVILFVARVCEVPRVHTMSGEEGPFRQAIYRFYLVVLGKWIGWFKTP